MPTGDGVSACITGLDRDLLKAIVKSPAAYYVNVHDADLPAGAVRGQLEQGSDVEARGDAAGLMLLSRTPAAG